MPTWLDRFQNAWDAFRENEPVRQQSIDAFELQRQEGRDQMAAVIAESLGDMRHDIRSEWSREAIAGNVPETQMQAYYTGRIDAHNAMANALYAQAQNGAIASEFVLPELIHIEAVANSVKQAVETHQDRIARQQANEMTPADLGYRNMANILASYTGERTPEGFPVPERAREINYGFDETAAGMEPDAGQEYIEGAKRAIMEFSPSTISPEQEINPYQDGYTVMKGAIETDFQIRKLSDQEMTPAGEIALMGRVVEDAKRDIEQRWTDPLHLSQDSVKNEQIWKEFDRGQNAAVTDWQTEQNQRLAAEIQLEIASEDEKNQSHSVGYSL